MWRGYISARQVRMPPCSHAAPYREVDQCFADVTALEDLVAAVPAPAARPAAAEATGGPQVSRARATPTEAPLHPVSPPPWRKAIRHLPFGEGFFQQRHPHLMRRRAPAEGRR